MTDLEYAAEYAPILHMDEAETIPLRTVGYTLFRQSAPSTSFPKRQIDLRGAELVIEYAFFFNYDIEHLYDLEHIWVWIDSEGQIMDAQGSYHGKYLNLLLPGFPGARMPTGHHVHAFCQPGKHAFLAAGEMTRLYPGWDRCCKNAGGPVLIGNPFCAACSPTGRDLFVPTPDDDRNSERWLREHLSFTPTLRFVEQPPVSADLLMPWTELYDRIPGWVADECARIGAWYENQKEA